MHYHRLMTRIETIRNDPRYAFMFENANVGGDTMGELLAHLFRLEPDGEPMTIMQLAGLPVEVVDAVVCVLCRLAFDFGLWSEGAMPLLFVCEEAHRYASADRTVGFTPTRRALSRIAKEGRKYGVYPRPRDAAPGRARPDDHLPVQHAVRHADGQRPRPGAAALGGRGRRRQPAGLRAVARHRRGHRLRRRRAVAGADDLQPLPAERHAAQRHERPLRPRTARRSPARPSSAPSSSAGAARP